MSVLLIRLAGPMQSWGTRSRFTNRDTGLEPSRSGVIGLLCAALGRPREQPVDDFSPLKMAVRVDREGRLMRDYHTAQSGGRADSAGGKQNTVVSERFYLADADFLVGLEGARPFLDLLEGALRRPARPLFLGRRAFPPSMPLCEGVNDGALIEVLESRPWRKRHRGERPPDQPLRGVIEVPYGTGEPRTDVPLSFVSRDRRFGVRHVAVARLLVPPVLEPDAESPDVPEQAGP